MKYVPFCMMVTDISACINELQFHALITCNYMNSYHFDPNFNLLSPDSMSALNSVGDFSASGQPGQSLKNIGIRGGSRIFF